MSYTRINQIHANSEIKESKHGFDNLTKQQLEERLKKLKKELQDKQEQIVTIIDFDPDGSYDDYNQQYKNEYMISVFENDISKALNSINQIQKELQKITAREAKEHAKFLENKKMLSLDKLRKELKNLKQEAFNFSISYSKITEEVQFKEASFKSQITQLESVIREKELIEQEEGEIQKAMHVSAEEAKILEKQIQIKILFKNLYEQGAKEFKPTEIKLLVEQYGKEPLLLHIKALPREEQFSVYKCILQEKTAPISLFFWTTRNPLKKPNLQSGTLAEINALYLAMKPEFEKAASRKPLPPKSTAFWGRYDPCRNRPENTCADYICLNKDNLDEEPQIKNEIARIS